MNHDTSKWGDKDFLAFLLIYASKADTKTTEEEVIWIKKKCQVSSFEHLLSLYNSQSDFQNLQTIQELREKHYPGEKGKVALKELLQEFFKSDGQYSLLEQNLMRILSRIL